MRRTLIVGFGIVYSLMTATSAMVSAKPPKGDLPVASIVSDYDSGVAPALQIQSDQQGAYRNSSTLTSTIASTGVWYLDSLNPRGATRTVLLQFNQPIAGSGPNGGAPVAPASGYYQVFMYTSCNHPNYQTSLLTLPPGQTMPCPMTVQFHAGGKTYFLHMNDRGIEFPTTNHVDITCISSVSDPCSQWRIRPSGTYVAPDGTTILRNVVNLAYQVTSKGQTSWVNQGDFYMSFLILVTNP